MKYTPNYNLKKPDETDYIMVEDLNENMDIVDSEFFKLSEKVEGIQPYVHPDTHPANMITTNENNRFVTDTEKARWNKTGEDLTAHIEDPLPHRFQDPGTGIWYKYGFGVDPVEKAVVMKYEEVV